MSAYQTRFICHNEGHEFFAPGPRESAYGEFIMRSETDLCVYLDAIADPVFAEIAESFPRTDKTLDPRGLNRSRLVHHTFSVTCDPAPDGSLYHIGLLPRCPVCGRRDNLEWSQVFPVEEVDLPAPTHECWNQLSATEKASLVEEYLRNPPAILKELID